MFQILIALLSYESL